MLSGSKPIIKKVELGDLIILTYDAKVKLLRMSIMQAKYKSIPYRNFLDSVSESVSMGTVEF